MGETRSWSSLLVHILVIALCLTAFGFAIAAERRRSTGSIVTDINNSTYCTYDSDISTGYGVGAFLFLLSGQSLLMGVTKCMCFGQPLAPGGSRAWSIIYFASSWLVHHILCIFMGHVHNRRVLPDCRSDEERVPHQVQAHDIRGELDLRLPAERGVHLGGGLRGAHHDPERVLLHVLHEVDEPGRQKDQQGHCQRRHGWLRMMREKSSGLMQLACGVLPVALWCWI